MFMLNKDQKANLKILREFLDKNRDVIDLDMGVFCEFKNEDGEEGEDLSTKDFYQQNLQEQGPACGASMCMLGWSGVLFPADPEQRFKESWGDLGQRVYGTSNLSSPVGGFLFDIEWAEREDTNTVDHAIYRIDRVLEAETEDDYQDLADEYYQLVDENCWED